MTNYTVIDLADTLRAAGAMALFYLAPGYVFGTAANVFEFRRRRPILKLLLGILLSIGCFPIITYLVERYVPHAVFGLYAVLGAIFVVLLARDILRNRPRLPHFSTYGWLCLLAVLVWVVLATGTLVDLQLHQRLYFSVPAYDYSTRTSFTAEMARSFPPRNPLFASNPPVPLRYHYFWLLPSGLLVQVLGVSPRIALYAATLWCGIGLMALIAVFGKFFVGDQALERKTFIGIILLLVTGLDIIPTITLALLPPHTILPDMEWWNRPQITSWVDSMIWVPHHLAALIACLFGFLVLQFAGGSRQAGRVTVAALAFASAAGLSVYVTFTFVLFVATWGVILAARRKWEDLRRMLLAGTVAALLGLGFLLTLKGLGGGHAFINIALRKFYFVTELLARSGYSSHLAGAIASAALLPLNYFLELGFFLLIGIDRFRRLRRGEITWTEQELAAWALVGTSFFVGTFLRSATIINNDLGYRCFLFAQFVFVLWAIPRVDDWWFARGAKDERPSSRRWRNLAAACALLGVAGTVYQVLDLRFYTVLADRVGGGTFRQEWLDSDGQLGERIYALRTAFHALKKELPGSAVVQLNPSASSYVGDLLYSDRATAAAGAHCGTVFGGNPEECVDRIRQLKGLFDGGPEIEKIDGACRKMGIDVLVATNTDAAWANPESWVWRRSPMVADNYVRAFWCGAGGLAGNGIAPTAGPAVPVARTSQPHP